MSVTKMYTFPMEKDGQLAVETKFCELINKYHRGEKLQPEVLDWMDSANNWLMTSEDK